MAYTTNPNLPRLRMQAVLMVRAGASTRAVARHFGYNQSTIVRWVARASEEQTHGNGSIPTRRSKPKSHPKALAPELVAAIVTERLKHGRCAEVVQDDLREQGIVVSLSSVKRTLARQELLRSRSKWKRIRPPMHRPSVLAPGDLVQTDTIHFIDWMTGQRFYIYTVIDLYSRTAYAEVHDRLRQTTALSVVLQAQQYMQFRFRTVQSDNGPEFARYFHDMLAAKGIALRHSRVRQSNDNAHIERFNRTIQDECLGRYLDFKISNQRLQVKLHHYLEFYNAKRVHLSLQYRTPNQMLQRS